MEKRNTYGKNQFRDFLTQKKQCSFQELKTHLVSSDIMNLATLYRIIDEHIREGFIHEIRIDGEKHFILCSKSEHAPHEHIILSYCHSCGKIDDEHAPQDPSILMSETITHRSFCNHCHS